MMYHRKAYGPHRCTSRQALAKDIAASILAAQQQGEHRPVTRYTQCEETIRLVEEQLAAAARESQLVQEGERDPTATAAQDLRICKYGVFGVSMTQLTPSSASPCIRKVRGKSCDACSDAPTANVWAGPAGSVPFFLP